MLLQGPTHDIAAKLRITAAFLGCAGQKDLCAAFRRVNPATDFDLERSYKWMQGRSLPRSARVYEDWSTLVSLDQGGGWIAACTQDEFVAALCRRHGLREADLLARAGMAQAASAGMAEANGSYLCGVYAGYSHAQSPYYRGRLLRSTLQIADAPRRADGLLATYSQALPIGRASAHGPVLLHGRAMCLDLRVPEQDGLAPVFCSFFRPSPPASLLMGMMCGTVAVHPGGQPPYATRIALLRVPPSAVPVVEETNRYLDDAPASLAEDLEALDLPGMEIAETLSRLLRPAPESGGADQIPPEEYAALAALCDRAWLS